jgi:hypothetical protein
MNATPESGKHPSATQRAWLRRGLDQPGGKLPLFDEQGGEIDPRTIRACIEQGWAAPWFDNPLKPGWLVCKLTGPGRTIAEGRPKTPIPSTKNTLQSTVIPIRKDRI